MRTFNTTEQNTFQAEFLTELSKNTNINVSAREFKATFTYNKFDTRVYIETADENIDYDIILRTNDVILQIVNYRWGITSNTYKNLSEAFKLL